MEEVGSKKKKKKPMPKPLREYGTIMGFELNLSGCTNPEQLIPEFCTIKHNLYAVSGIYLMRQLTTMSE